MWCAPFAADCCVFHAPCCPFLTAIFFSPLNKPQGNHFWRQPLGFFCRLVVVLLASWWLSFFSLFSLATHFSPSVISFTIAVNESSPSPSPSSTTTRSSSQKPKGCQSSSVTQGWLPLFSGPLSVCKKAPWEGCFGLDSIVCVCGGQVVVTDVFERLTHKTLLNEHPSPFRFLWNKNAHNLPQQLCGVLVHCHCRVWAIVKAVGQKKAVAEQLLPLGQRGHFETQGLLFEEGFCLQQVSGDEMRLLLPAPGLLGAPPTPLDLKQCTACDGPSCKHSN